MVFSLFLLFLAKCSCIELGTDHLEVLQVAMI